MSGPTAAASVTSGARKNRAASRYGKFSGTVYLSLLSLSFVPCE